MSDEFDGVYTHRPGGRVYTVDEGPGGAEPVVFVHGNPTSSYYFRSLIRELAPDHRCVAIDHLGCGKSDKPTLAQYDFRLESRISDLGAVLAARGVTENVTLVLHDWGGMIGLAWAARNPGKLKRLVCINTGGFPLPASKPLPPSLRLGRDTALGKYLILRHNAFCRLAARWCVTRRPLPPEVRAAYLAPHDTPEHRLSVWKFVQTIPLSPKDDGSDIVAGAGESLAKLSGVPTLLLWGMRDFVFDRHFLAEFQRRMPHAETRTWPDCGHYLLEDAPEEVAPAVREFLARHPIPAAQYAGH